MATENTEDLKGSSGESPAAAAQNNGENLPKNEGNGQEKSELELTQEKLQQAEKKYLYLYAEFENFRRRMERDRLDFIKFGHESFLRDLLQVIDNFDRALVHAKSSNPEKTSALGNIVMGLEMTLFQFNDVLKAQGVTEVKSAGAKFDPSLHEAVSEEESDQEPGTILKELTKGYLLHGRLLRPARVVTAKKV